MTGRSILLIALLLCVCSGVLGQAPNVAATAEKGQGYLDRIFCTPQFAQGAITALGSILAAGLLIYFAHRSALLEGISMTEASLNVTISARVIDGPPGGDKILETQIEIQNNARRAYSIPAVYLCARALSLKQGVAGDSDFWLLPACGPLSDIKNVGRIPGSIIQVAPDEIERLVRWDPISMAFAGEFPVIVINAEVFSADVKYLGDRNRGLLRSKPSVGRDRHLWLEFMKSDNYARDNYIVFGRWDPHGNEQPELTRFQYFLKLGNQDPGLDNSKKFRKVLPTVARWTRQITVDLRTGTQQHLST
jgi:hypothetical protein